MSRTAQQILETLGEDLPQTLYSAIQEAADVAIEDMKNRLVVKNSTNTPSLRDSIRAIINENDGSLELIMNEYGYFQNYGVAGVKNKRTQMGIDEPVALAFGSSTGDIMSFGTGNYDKGGKPWGAYYSGIEAKDFIKLDQFLEDIESYLKQNLEL